MELNSQIVAWFPLASAGTYLEPSLTVGLEWVFTRGRRLAERSIADGYTGW